MKFFLRILSPWFNNCFKMIIQYSLDGLNSGNIYGTDTQK